MVNWWYDEKAAETYGADYHFSIVVAQQTDSNGSIDVSLCEVGEDWVEVTPFNYMNDQRQRPSGFSFAGNKTFSLSLVKPRIPQSGRQNPTNQKNTGHQ